MPQQFSCEWCGKNYAWKVELAGKKVRCESGHVMTAPQSPPAELETEELYDLADGLGRALSTHAGKSPSECLGPCEGRANQKRYLVHRFTPIFTDYRKTV